MKYILGLVLIICVHFAGAQTPSDTFWHLNAEYGIDWDKANDFVKDKKNSEIIVAVIDAGVDVNHIDLKDNIWVNTEEIADNGIDDDNNGFVDDVYGWNFCGDVTHDNLEVTRLYVELNEKYEFKDDVSESDPEYLRYLRIKTEYLAKKKENDSYYNVYTTLKKGMGSFERTYGKNITLDILKAHKSGNRTEEITRLILLEWAKENPEFIFQEAKEEINEAYKYFKDAVKYLYNTSFDPRAKLVGDDYEDVSETNYGNNKVYYGDDFSSHGTHVAGIIASNNSNDLGSKGIANAVKIMSIRAVPDGDERDKDVANSIRYAVDNGAKIINMSFGKAFAKNENVVYDAIEYAKGKNVLLVHGAGNDGENNDETDNYPNDSYGKFQSNWIEVGASTWIDKKRLIADFSNYGEEEVDVFAPGVAIYSTIPENKYKSEDGTSMASPVVSGIAAFIWSYYPSLAAQDVRNIILESVVPIDKKQHVPNSKKKKCATKLSQTGGIVNVYNAIVLADQLSNK